MQLRAMRIRKGRQQKELAKAIGTDEPMMSKFENYKCLPIPPMMKALCDELGCEVGDIYEPHEIFLTSPKVTVKVSKGSKKKKEFYHLTVNLPPEAREFFKEALGKCGPNLKTRLVCRIFCCRSRLCGLYCYGIYHD